MWQLEFDPASGIVPGEGWRIIHNTTRTAWDCLATIHTCFSKCLEHHHVASHATIISASWYLSPVNTDIIRGLSATSNTYWWTFEVTTYYVAYI